MTFEVVTLTGPELVKAVPDLGRLRIEVFREFPYLYDGTIAYEEKYLASLAASADSIIAVARENGQTVGCSTGSALTGHHGEFAEPFRVKGYDLNGIFYCSESVLRQDYRGRGLGHAFFEKREAHARARGYKYSAFCGIIRPADHPLRPANYRPLDEFWTKRGYRQAEGIIANFRWKDIDQPEETDHPMQFWIKEL